MLNSNLIDPQNLQYISYTQRTLFLWHFLEEHSQQVRSHFVFQIYVNHAVDVMEKKCKVVITTVKK